MKIKAIYLLLLLAFTLGCAEPEIPLNTWTPYDQSKEIEENKEHSIKRMRYKRIQSQHSDRNALFTSFKKELSKFTQADHDRLKPLILEQNIPTLQQHLKAGKLTYEALTLFYLYRIYHFELQRETYLNAIISLNPNVIENARERDKNKSEPTSPLYGMPILIKDNINATPMATTAGAAVFTENFPERDAFIVEKLRSEGALILGKVNLSEWAYYFCQGCPVGYSALGGQTLNPYGRKMFESGGSSSGSGVTVAANYAVAALGSETSGSILSPSGKNSVVGLKPTIGSISRSGIVPISSSLDTAGPMAKNVIDAAILYNAIIGKDSLDGYSFAAERVGYESLPLASLKGKRLGLIRAFESDSLMQIAIAKMEAAGAEIIPIDPPETPMNQFRKLLDVDMHSDLPIYISAYAGPLVTVKTAADIVAFNRTDTLLHAPYGQAILERVATEETTQADFEQDKLAMMQEAKNYFLIPMQEHQIEAIISIDNRTAGYAAMAHFPALSVPMGYLMNGEPQNITFIAPSQHEPLLFTIGAAFEHLHPARKTPLLFQ